MAAMKKFIGCFRGEPSQQRQVLANHPSVTFKWKEIVKGTQNFRDSLGEGNFGRVYRCDLPRHNTVGAVKLEDPNAQTEFETEITTLYRANHPNVIRLLGKSFGMHLCVVYELMPNGSLDNHLFGEAGKRANLDWNKRMGIALGVAKALVYVHNELKVVHRDIKSANVLLDADFVPKLTDFGIVTRIVEDEEGCELPTSGYPNKGSPGFLAPESDVGGRYGSTKSDVYSYGVLLFELFTGRQAYDDNRPLATRDITDWLKSVGYSEENIHRVIDPKLGSRYSIAGLKRVFEVANLCIKEYVSQRPTMSIVEGMIRQASACPVPDSPTRVSI